LQKAEPGASTPPKKPIVFWIEKTVPFKFRKPIREGILEWNKAFEKAGYLNAIEVRQQPDNADWDAEDVNYNTFRWITSSAKFAMGPSRVNPLNGQILNASVIFDADFLQAWKTEYEVFTPKGIAALTGGPLDLKTYEEETRHAPHGNPFADQCSLEEDEARQFAFGSAVLMGRAGTPQMTAAEEERLVAEGLKEVTMHEIGHTLGLRHNFKASTQLSLEDINNPEKAKDSGMGSSVMDYYPVNVVPSGTKQGNFYSPTIGSYDMWAIEYGYKPTGASEPEAEVAEMNKIASRSGEPGLQYSTDEDTRGIDPDPLSNRFDLGNDAVEFAKQRAKVVAEVWPKLVDKVTKDGDGYQRVRQAFGVLLSEEGQAMHFASRYVGGVYVNRSHKGDPKAADPYVVTEPKKQREALKLIEDQVFSDAPFDFPPSLYNHMAATRWSHWGSEVPMRNDYPVHEVIALWQDRILQQLLSPLTLTRICDSELKARRSGRLYVGRVDPRLDFDDLRRDREAALGRVHQPQASDQQPAAELTADLPQAPLGVGDGRNSGPARQPDNRLQRNKDDRGAEQQASQGQLKARRLLQGPPAGNSQSDCQSDRCAIVAEESVMKLIVAIIQPTKLNAVRDALNKIEVTRMTVCDAQGYARQRGQTELYRGHEYKTHLLRKIALEIMVNDDFLERTVDAIVATARTGSEGQIGDGKIFVLPALETIQLFGEVRGQEAV
jgi:nitrogen regulatory protein PII